MCCFAKTVLPGYVAVRRYHRAAITNGPKTSLRLERYGWLETQRRRQTRIRLDEDRLTDNIAILFESGDPWVEAQHIINVGGEHKIGKQRAREIVANAKRGKAFTARWNQAVYPHLTRSALRSIQARPGPYDNPSLA